MVEKQWRPVSEDRVGGDPAVLAARAGISPLTARLLMLRGVRDADQVRHFLRPRMEALIPPERFEEMPAAVERIRRAVKENEPIGVVGDYDVDGITATAILVRFFRLLDLEVTTHIPHRLEEGYGLRAETVDRLAEAGVRLIIAVDCGTCDREAIERAKTLGIDVIVGDHHEPPEERVPALAILNPKMAETAYPFNGICSAVIALKLAWAVAADFKLNVRGGEPYEKFLFDALGMAALGTVADVSPVLDENRSFITFGLEALSHASATGLRGLLEKCRLTKKAIDGFDVSFRIAPRLNAVGRMGKAAETLELLVTDSREKVDAILERMEKANKERRSVEEGITRQALEQVRNTVDLSRDRVILVADSRWHAGVVGIVASRLVDEFHRPAFVLTIEDGEARGSGRSIEGFPLHEALESCGSLMTRYGGHAMAAGLTLPSRQIGAVREGLNEFARSRMTEADLRPSLEVEAEVTLDHLDEGTVREIGSLSPHGPGNPVPVLCTRDLVVAGRPTLMGKRSDHLSFHVRQNGVSFRVVGFGFGKRYADLVGSGTCSLAFTPMINEWGGRREVELRLKDLHLPAGEKPS